jgi:hypothetical protein
LTFLQVVVGDMEQLLMREGSASDDEAAGPVLQTSSEVSSTSSSSRGSSSSRDTVLSCTGGREDSYVAGSWHPDYLDRGAEIGLEAAGCLEADLEEEDRSLEADLEEADRSLEADRESARNPLMSGESQNIKLGDLLSLMGQ